MKLILHIGQQKTGSTSLQSFLFDNYKSLIDKGYLYPKSLGIEYKKQHLLFKEHKPSNNNGESLKAPLLQEIKDKNASTVIISDENLYSGILVEKEKISAFLTSIFDEIDIIIYL
ncbi:MAG: hypothetical protein HKO66_13760, partial [Saprospiraceae bacterium]|nr:hypothetical protein [Bacteroidia bacterium]NNL93301.1 hypothetical protein [Saprospiraceae bacterium]